MARDKVVSWNDYLKMSAAQRSHVKLVDLQPPDEDYHHGRATLGENRPTSEGSGTLRAGQGGEERAVEELDDYDDLETPF